MLFDEENPRDFCPRLASTPLKLPFASPSSLPYFTPPRLPFASPAYPAIIPYSASGQIPYDYTSNKPLDFIEAIKASEQACAPDSSTDIKFPHSPHRSTPVYYPISDEGSGNDDMVEEANIFNHNQFQWHSTGHSAKPHSGYIAQTPDRIYRNIKDSLDWLKFRGELSADSGIGSIRRSHDDMSQSQEDCLFPPPKEGIKQTCLDYPSFDTPSSTSFMSPDANSENKTDAEVANHWQDNKGKMPFVENILTSLENPPKYQSDAKVGRKIGTPTRSASPTDPTFRGVTLQMRTQLQQNEVHLSIKAYFNCRKGGRSVRKPSNRRTRSRISPHGSCSSSDSEGTDTVYRERKRRNCIAGKQCASCGTKTTPLWRDAEDGTPLCNACGIRYKKYRIHCGRCWHIPRKDTKMNPCCTNCGESLKLSLMRSKHW